MRVRVYFVSCPPGRFGPDAGPCLLTAIARRLPRGFQHVIALIDDGVVQTAVECVAGRQRVFRQTNVFDLVERWGRWDRTPNDGPVLELDIAEIPRSRPKVVTTCVSAVTAYLGHGRGAVTPRGLERRLRRMGARDVTWSSSSDRD